ncbi:MAG: hypothetical protein AAGG08_10390 [Actinomycetota bacterium]
MFDDTNRPRIGLALVVTAVALVVWVVMQAGSSDESAADTPETAPVPTAINGVPLESADVADDTATAPTSSADVPSRPRVESPDDVPVFMDGDTPVGGDTAVPEIAVPEAPAIEPLRQEATYRSTISGFRTCLVRELESGLTVTVTNVDNGRSTTCVTALAPSNQIDDVVMHTRSFQQIADLTEAPIVVEIIR